MSAGKYDALQPSRDMQLLAPRFREAVRAAIAECNAAGLDAFVYEAYRSDALQAHYYKRGRTVVPPVEPVTNARTNQYSWHGYGLAVDVISRSKHWKAGDAWFQAVATIFAKHQCKWGGRWKRPDLPHFQWHLCRPSPSDRARELLRTGGLQAVWKAVGAADADPPTPTIVVPAGLATAPLPGTRVLFERAMDGTRTVTGELIRRVQQGLVRAGRQPGALDGIFGAGTERALTEWQTGTGAPPTGKVDLHAWQSLVSPQVPPLYERALQVTAAFEEHGFGLAVGNFDNGWLTWGIIGFNLRRGVLGPLLKELRREHPQLFRSAFGPLEAQLVRVLDSDAATKERWANSVSLPPGRRRLLPEWKAAFAALGSAPEAQGVQLRYAEDYWRRALSAADRFGLRTELGLALCFDIAVQNGSIEPAEEERARRFLQAHPPQSERDVRVAVANAVAEGSIRRYVEDVRSRKLTLATGAGRVHGARYSVGGWGLGEVVAVS